MFEATQMNQYVALALGLVIFGLIFAAIHVSRADYETQVNKKG